MSFGEFKSTKKQSGQGDFFMAFCGAFFLVVLAFVLSFYFITGLSSPRGIGIDREAFEITGWQYCPEDSSDYIDVELPFSDSSLGKGVFASFRTTLPNDLTDRDYLSFANSKHVEVYIDGKLRKDFVPGRDVYVPGGLVRAEYILFPLYSSDSGKTVEIRRVDENRPNGLQREVIIGESHAIVTKYFYDESLLFFCGLFLTVLSILLIITCFVLHFAYKTNIYLTAASFGVLMVSLWIVTDSRIFPFIFERQFVEGTMSYFFCMLIPPPFLSYFNAIQKGRYKSYYYVLQVLSFLNLAVFSYLHFKGILFFADSMTTIDIILAVITVFAMIILGVDMKRGYLNEYKFTVGGMFIFMIFTLIESVSINIVKSYVDGIFLFIGLFVLLAFAVIQQIDDLRTTDMERQAAIDDSIAKTNFLASMSHEIRTPINTILGMNEMILRENEDVTINQYAKNAQSAGRMLLALVNDVLDFSKIEVGKLEILEDKYKLGESITNINTIAFERADSKGLEYSFFIEKGVPAGLIGDELRVRQILINLVSNAIKYSDKGSVNVRFFGEYIDDDTFDLKFSVADTGKGILKEEIDHLFDAFTRADINKNKTIEGTGLGLAIVKRLLDAMNGDIKVESVYGEGSTFTVTIPQKVYDKSVITINPEEARVRKVEDAYKAFFTAPDAKILTVDDNGANLRIAYEFLKETKVKQSLIKSPADAIELCFKNKYDLILLDHMMPEIDGIAVLDKIKNDTRSVNKDTNVIVLTANAVAGSKEMYLEAGFVDYISKPIDSRLLEKKVAQYLPEDKVFYNN